MASDSDITRPHNPLPRLEMTSDPSHWHVQLEVRPEQLIALHRMGYTSGALAWREGMDRWQPLRVGVEEETELSEADIESSSDEDGEAREASGTQARLDEAEPTLARADSRRSFVFPRGHASGAPAALVQAPPISNRPPAPEDHVLDDLFARPLPPPPRMPGSASARSSDDAPDEPLLRADPPETEAHYTPAPLALVPKPSWLTQTHPMPVAIERPISIPPPAVLDMYHGPHALLRPRTLWLGMGATVLLSAAVAALVSSLVWHLQSRFAEASVSAVDEAAARAPAEPPKRAEVTASAPAEPQPTSVSVDQLPLLRGTRAAPVTITAPDPPRRPPEHRELPRREPARAANVEEGSNRSPSRAAVLGLPQSGKGSAPVAKQSSAIDEQIAERVAEEAEPARHAEPSEAPGPATPAGLADRDAVARAVAQAAVAARSCGTSPETGQVLVKFAPSGSAQSIQLLKPFSNRDVNACVLRAMSRARIAPFAGEAVSVRKSVRW